MPTGQSYADSGTAPWLSPIGTASRRRLFDSMLAQGVQSTPIGHWTQGLGRLTQAMVGGYGGYQADEEEREGIRELGRVLAGTDRVPPTWGTVLERAPRGRTLGSQETDDILRGIISGDTNNPAPPMVQPPRTPPAGNNNQPPPDFNWEMANAGNNPALQPPTVRRVPTVPVPPSRLGGPTGADVPDDVRSALERWAARGRDVPFDLSPEQLAEYARLFRARYGSSRDPALIDQELLDLVRRSPPTANAPPGNPAGLSTPFGEVARRLTQGTPELDIGGGLDQPQPGPPAPPVPPPPNMPSNQLPPQPIRDWLLSLGPRGPGQANPEGNRMPGIDAPPDLGPEVPLSRGQRMFRDVFGGPGAGGADFTQPGAAYDDFAGQRPPPPAVPPPTPPANEWWRGMHGSDVPGSATPPPPPGPVREVIQPPAPPETQADIMRRLLTSRNPQSIAFALQIYRDMLRRPGQEPPSGFRWNADRTRLEAIPGGPGEQVSADVAGRLAGMRSATRDLPEAARFFTRNWSSAETLSAAVGHPRFNEEYNRMRRVVQTAVEGVLRAETGQAATETEVARLMARYMPTVTDTPAVAQQKMAMLQAFIQEYESVIMRGRGGQQGQGGQWTDLGGGIRIRPAGQ